MIKLLMFTMILVGCASNNVAENEVNDINENPKVQDEKVEDNNLSTITENNEVTEYIEQPQPQTESENIVYDTQPVDNTPSSEPVVEQVPACDDAIPYGGYTSWGEVNALHKLNLMKECLRKDGLVENMMYIHFKRNVELFIIHMQ